MVCENYKIDCIVDSIKVISSVEISSSFPLFVITYVLTLTTYNIICYVEGRNYYQKEARRFLRLSMIFFMFNVLQKKYFQLKIL